MKTESWVSALLICLLTVQVVLLGLLLLCISIIGQQTQALYNLFGEGSKWLLVILVVLLVFSIGSTTVVVADLALQGGFNIMGDCDPYWVGCCGLGGSEMLIFYNCPDPQPDYTVCTGSCPN